MLNNKAAALNAQETKVAMLSDLVRLLKEETVDRVFVNVFETSNGYDIDLHRSLGSSLGSKTDHRFLKASAEDFSTVDELALFLETAIKESFPKVRIFNHGSGINESALELACYDLKESLDQYNANKLDAIIDN